MEVGKLTAYSLGKDFSPIYYNTVSGLDSVTRILHNSEQVVLAQLRDGTPPVGTIQYYNMDGTVAAQFTITSGGSAVNYVVDLCWSVPEDRFLYIAGSGTHYGIYKALSNGTTVETVIADFSSTDIGDWSASSINGELQIAAGEADYFIKAGGALYRFPSTVTGSGVITDANFCSTGCGTLSGNEVPSGYMGIKLTEPNAFYPTNGTNCLNFQYQRQPYWDVASGVVTSGNLYFSWYDSEIDVVYFRNIIPSGNMSYSQSRWSILQIDNYSSYAYPLFVNNSDPYSLHYIDGTSISGASNILNVFNIDTNIAAFINLNSTDIVMAAGIGDTAQITATVINCYGEPLAGKVVDFWISAGDGSITRLDNYTNAQGQARATFYAGSTVGTVQINAVVNEI